jgi:hypothetical protein
MTQEQMNKQERLKIRNEWKKWLKNIETELTDLLIARQIFDEIANIVNQNQNIQSPARLHLWIVKNYAHRIAMGIRRIIDPDKKNKQAISLYRLLDDIKQHLQAIPRSDFVSEYPQWMRKRGCADNYFNRFAKKEQPWIDPERIKRDQRTISSEKTDIKKFRDFVDNWVAHNDPLKKVGSVPALAKLNKLLTRLHNLVRKYHLLLEGTKIPTLVPSIGDDWKKPLTQPWIKNESTHKTFN